ncbi:YjbE family putative metal transport protein [Lentibacillus sediminis]|uniref:YjbE family putative metal transport protein n=1 Tax=Lentibacillus sediminis TaxID=1940529 RepID=UPI000C1C4915|nr:YjbE family putative metal transport protein [Lentibacillus sediminis]
MEWIEILTKILVINLILSGDNAVVIAMASRNLPEHLQKKAIRWGTLGGITLRILFTFLMVFLLNLPLIQLIGGILLLLVSYKLLVDKHEEKKIKVGNSLLDAVMIIILADLIMSLDNVLAIAAIANNDLFLIMIGITLSIPIILIASQFMMRLMQKYAIIIYIGAGLLAWTAGDMMLKEPPVRQFFETNGVSELLFLTGVTVIIMVLGWIRRKQLELHRL